MSQTRSINKAYQECLVDYRQTIVLVGGFILLPCETKSFEIQCLQILNEDGELKSGVTLPPDIILKSLYEKMVLTRVSDEKSISLQRQGRLGTYASIRGQEAVSVAAGLALQKEDWLFPAFRDYGAYFARGYPVDQLLLYWAGDERGSQIPPGFNIFTIAVPVSTQIPHAVGAAWGLKLKKKPNAALVFFGDGATSKGDFHEGLNMAGVFHLPLVLLCQNNQWAISVPRTRQTASATIAQKAIAYGFPGIQVDGNDALAVYSAASEALKRARAGQGPTLIEAVTYRMGDHTTSDDASRYRTKKELKEWQARDPIQRFEKFLTTRSLWDEAYGQQVLNKAKTIVEDAVKKIEALPPPDPKTIFTYMYAALPWSLEEQLNDFSQYLSQKREEKL